MLHLQRLRSQNYNSRKFGLKCNWRYGVRIFPQNNCMYFFKIRRNGFRQIGTEPSSVIANKKFVPVRCRLYSVSIYFHSIGDWHAIIWPLKRENRFSRLSLQIIRNRKERTATDMPEHIRHNTVVVGLGYYCCCVMILFFVNDREWRLSFRVRE